MIYRAFDMAALKHQKMFALQQGIKPVDFNWLSPEKILPVAPITFASRGGLFYNTQTTGTALANLVDTSSFLKIISINSSVSVAAFLFPLMVAPL